MDNKGEEVMKKVLVIALIVCVMVGAVGWLLFFSTRDELWREVATLKAEKFALQEAFSGSAGRSLEYRLSCHKLVGGDAVCDVYAGSERGFCYWEEACRGRSLKIDRRGAGEACVGYFICSEELHRINLPAGPEVDEPPHSAPESELDDMGY